MEILSNLNTDNKAYQFNRLLLFLIVIAPIPGYVFLNFLNIDLFAFLQFFSFVGIILLLIFRQETKPIVFPNYLFFYLLFILYVFYSTFFMLDRDFKLKYIFGNRLIGGFNFMFIILNVPITKKHFKLLTKYSIYILLFAFIVILIQEKFDASFFLSSKFERADLIANDGSHENRLMSIYSWIGELNEIGFGFVPVFIFITEYFIREKRKIFLWILMGLIFALLSKARWLMLNTLLVFVLLIVNKKDRLREIIKYSFLLPIASLFIYFTLNFIGLDVKGIIDNRILEKNESMSKKSASTRLLAFEAFDRLYWDNAVFGKGAIKYGMGATGEQDYKLKKFLRRRSSQIHVGYLNLLYMYGMIGGFFFLSFLVLLLRSLYKQAIQMRVWSPFLSFLGLAIANLTLVTFSTFQMGLLVVFIVNNYCYQIYQKSKLNV